MKIRARVGVAIILAAVVGLSWFVWKLASNGAETDLATQLRLARAEGLPTSFEELVDSIPAVKPSENADRYYGRLPEVSTVGEEAISLASSLSSRPDPRVIAKARALIFGHVQQLRWIESATAQSRFGIEHESYDMYLAEPDFVLMLGAARLLALRGSLAAQRGEVANALRDFSRALRIAGHATVEPLEQAVNVQQTVCREATAMLADWALAHPDVAACRSALASAVDAWPPVSLKRAHRADLFRILRDIDTVTNPTDPTHYAMKDDGLSLGRRVSLALARRSRAEARVVLAERRRWSALGLPPIQRAILWRQASSELRTALERFQFSSYFYKQFDGVLNTATEDLRNVSVVEYSALARALIGGKIAKSIRTDDLISPVDGKPIRYSAYDSSISVWLEGKPPPAGVGITWILPGRFPAPSGSPTIRRMVVRARH